MYIILCKTITGVGKGFYSKDKEWTFVNRKFATELNKKTARAIKSKLEHDWPDRIFYLIDIGVNNETLR